MSEHTESSKSNDKSTPASTRKGPLKAGTSLIKETFSEFLKDKATRLSAALAYYSVFSLAPVLVISISIAGAIFGEKAARGVIREQLTEAIGPDSASVVQGMIESVHQSGSSLVMTLVGIGTLLITASGIFAQLKDAMNTVWGLEAKPGLGIKGFVKTRLLAVSMVLIIGFLLLFSLILSTVTNALGDWIESVIPVHDLLFHGVGLLLSISTVAVLFAMIFKLLPDADIQWRDVWIGALITSCLFTIGKTLLALYLGREQTASPYGAAGALILLLTWIYYSANILLLGAEFTQVYARRRGRNIQPNAFAVRIN